MDEKELLLIEKSQNGDVEAFEQLIIGYEKKVYNIALRMINNHHDANELAQEVFIKLFKSIKSFKRQSSFSTWIYRITTNVCLDELRRRKNKKAISLDREVQTCDSEMQMQIVDSSPGPEMLLESKEQKQFIKDSLSLLSEEHRYVIIMRDINGFSYDEIADLLKCPPGTVKSRINRARQALKEILKSNKELFNETCVK